MGGKSCAPDGGPLPPMVHESPDGGSMKARVLAALKSLHGWLNTLGSIMLAYALANPTAATELLNLLPANLKTPVVLGAPALWFCLVAYAKARAIKKASQA